MTKDRFRAKPVNRYTSKKRQAQNEREDDQIAPKAVAHSIDALQRWALFTANLSPGSHRANEAQTVERIRNRYENEGSSLGLHKDIDPDSEATHSDRTFRNTASKKREPPISPTGSLQLSKVYSKDVSEADVRSAKRRRSRSPEACSMDGDDNYAQSSEWSFPSEDEVKVTIGITKKVTKTRTQIEID